MTETPVAAPDDHIVSELRGELELVVGEALDRAESRSTLESISQESDRVRIRADVRQQVLDQSDDVLRQTNPEISAYREASLALHRHVVPTSVTPDQSTPNRRSQLRRFGVVLWLGIAFPVAVWQSWPVLTRYVPGFVVVPFYIAAAVGLLSLVRPIHRGTGDQGYAVYGPAWTLTFGIGVTYLLSLWRLWDATGHAMNDFLRALLWVVAGLVAFVLELGASGIATLPDKEAKYELIPLKVSRPGVYTGLVAGLATAVVLLFPLAGWSFVLPLLVPLVIQVVIGPWIVTNPGALRKVVPARLSQDPNRRGSSEWLREEGRLFAALVDTKVVWRKAAGEAVLALVTWRVNEAIRPPFSIEIGELDRTGLGQMRAGERAVATAAFAELRELTENITGGAIGLAGPRGAGKTTLLEAYQAGKYLRPGYEHVALLESVPVRYDARDFALHLYARTCTEVIRFCGRHVTEVRSPWPRRLAWCRRWAPVVLVVAAWLAVGFVGANTVDGRHVNLLSWLAAVWWPAVLVLGAVSTGYLASRRRLRPTPEPVDLAEAADSPLLLSRLARERLDAIRFQQKHTSGWSGKVGLLFGAEASRSASDELTRQPMTYPQIVHEFGTFLSATVRCLSRWPNVATPSVVIILDELDKILSPEQAQDFVNEVKALFNLDVPGFLFLVSVSEDALSSFERRGLPVRDAFDSAFDLIFRVEYLKLDDSRAILSSRILLLPEPFICLCHCMAGGLPRELIRVARQVAAKRGTLAKVCRDIVAADLRGKVAGLRTLIARHDPNDVQGSELMRHVDAHAIADATTLLAAAAKPPIGPSPDASLNEDVFRLQHEILGYFYYCGTVLEMFGPGFTEQDMAKGRDSDGDASFDTLTSVRQLFSVNARLAWLTVSAFRTAWGRAAIDPPPGRR